MAKLLSSQPGGRLDVAVLSLLPNLSRASVQKLCDQGLVKINGEPAKPGYRLKKDDKLEVDYDPSVANQIPQIELEVIYEDEDCIVINKPSGVLTHSKGSFNPEATVASFIANKLNGLSGERAGIVHRLDRDTSGVIICAKNPESLKWLQKQFATRKVKKIYMAIVAGQPNPPQAIIDMPIARNPKKPQTFRVNRSGKPALTEYRVIKSQCLVSLVELKPHTGRTHQLRVHLSHIGYPIVGDNLYSGTKAERLYLHALFLELTLPNHDRRIFKAALPPDFNDYLKQ